MAQNKQRVMVSADVAKPPIRSFKIIVVGDSFVGKTCLTFRFCDNKFVQSTATIGLDLREKTVIIDEEPVKASHIVCDPNGHKLQSDECGYPSSSVPVIQLVLWDTAGQERYRNAMTSHYYRNCNAVIFVYDVTKVETFKSLYYWIAECKDQGIDIYKVPCILIGNKYDCVDKIKVPRNMAMRFADTYRMPLFETSASSDDDYPNIEGIFMTLAHKLKDSKPFGLPADSSVCLHTTKPKEKEKSWCCLFN